MSPEFVRNIWLELTPRRIAFMVVVLALIFFAAAISGGKDWRPESIAQFLYYFIVVFWGSRNAALSVVGEIRDRTWDMQRLSSLSAGALTWGKLFGSTSYNWFGGAICLVVLLASRLVHQGALTTLIDFVYFVVVGVIAQSASLFASLIAARRRRQHTRLGVFAYQVTGMLAAICVYAVWQAADPASSFLLHKKAVDTILWWGQRLDARPFLLASLAVFAGWLLLACFRLMRVELQMRNGPLVWLAFLAFVGVYVAGFDAWVPSGRSFSDVIAQRLALAVTAYAVLTYLTILLEPKDRVLYRWIGGELAELHVARAGARLQAWMMSYIATLIVGAALFSRLFVLSSHIDASSATTLAALGFLSRDAALFLLFQALPGRRRSDFAVVVTLFALYALIPAILEGLDLGNALVIFYPKPSDPLWLNPACAWGEAVIVAVLAVSRLSRTESLAAQPAPA